jgi:hypothetical protein
MTKLLQVFVVFVSLLLLNFARYEFELSIAQFSASVGGFVIAWWVVEKLIRRK